MREPADTSTTPRYAPRPRWVKILGVVAVLVLLATIVVLITGVPHGPGMHGGLGHDTSASQSAAVRW